MSEKRFILINCTKPGTRSNILDYQKKHNEGVGDELWLGEVVDMLNQLTKENEKLKKYNKGQELEIVRLHNLADAMGAVLRELGIYDVYNDEQIENVKRRVK